ncbi:MAG: rRNA maturation RNase YbeY [Bacteroidales bacterium]|nr:rRNA maturation RNase YbeY [Bacteroidales bacterium]
MIYFYNEGVDLQLKDKLVLKQWIKKVVQSYGLKVGNLSYIFCSDDKIIEVNRQFLQHDYYTDIITFDYDEDGVVSGDMYISVDTVMTNSQKFAPSFERELHRVIIHGVLHLCGLKDKQPDEEQKMRQAEDNALQLLDQLFEEKKIAKTKA